MEPARIELASESALARFLQVCPGSDLAHKLPPGRTAYAPAPWSLACIRRSAPKHASLIFAVYPLYQTLRGNRHRLSGKSQLFVGFCCFGRFFAERRPTRTCHLYPVHSRRNRSAPMSHPLKGGLNTHPIRVGMASSRFVKLSPKCSRGKRCFPSALASTAFGRSAR